MASMFETITRGAAWESLVGVHGITVTYTPHGGIAEEISGLWRPGQKLGGWVEHGEVEEDRGVLTVSPDDVSSPDTRDQVAIDGVTWAVERVEQGGPYWTLELIRHRERQAGFGSTRKREDL